MGDLGGFLAWSCKNFVQGDFVLIVANKGEEASILCSASVRGKESLVDPTLARGIKQGAEVQGLPG